MEYTVVEVDIEILVTCNCGYEFATHITDFNDQVSCEKCGHTDYITPSDLGV